VGQIILRVAQHLPLVGGALWFVALLYGLGLAASRMPAIWDRRPEAQ
jgi:hypothetical protein